ncbi:MAG TPA: CHAP domain-containing protein, partial [Blastocatellia bacterium]|nr:CHAP domain-containing protein [Blastocatellia bacterium]
KPGMVFVMKFSNTTGHTGIVESVDVAKKTVTSIEGNTNDDGSREGYEVARRTRTIESINVGFIDFSQSSKR